MENTNILGQNTYKFSNLKHINNICKKVENNIFTKIKSIDLVPNIISSSKPNFEDKNILKLKENIKDITKHVYHYCQRLCFGFQVFKAFTFHLKSTSSTMKIMESNNKLSICKHC
jgi:hypothetical protein